MSGKNYQVYLSSTGLAGGTMTLIEYQGDLTINTGKTLSTTPFKVGAKTAQGNDGWSASFTMSPTEPLGTGQALVLSCHNNDGIAYVEVKYGTTTGSVKWAGPIKINISEMQHPVSGENIWTVQMNEDGTMTQTIV